MKLVREEGERRGGQYLVTLTPSAYTLVKKSSGTCSGIIKGGEKPNTPEQILGDYRLVVRNLARNPVKGRPENFELAFWLIASVLSTAYQRVDVLGKECSLLKNTSTVTVRQTRTTQTPVCKVEWCEKPSPKGSFCPQCFARWQDPELPDGKARCNDRDCAKLVTKHPDGRSGLCVRCDSLRLIIGASRALKEGYLDNPPQEPAEVLSEAEEHWSEGDYQKARGAARRFFTVFAKTQIEEALGTFMEDESLGTKSQELFDRMLVHYRRDEYFKGQKVLSEFMKIVSLESELNEINQATLSFYAQEAYDDARRALVSGNLIEVRSSIETMESIESRVAEMEEGKRQAFERNPGSGRKSRKLRRQEHDSGWKKRLGAKDEEAVTTVP